VLHRLRPARGGGLVARPELVRRSRSAIAIEVALADAAPAALGHAALGFAVLPAREGQRRMGVGADEPRTEFALPGSSLEGSLVERIGARCLDPAAGRFELALAPYAANSLGALQGGMLALLADLAGEAAGGAALGSDCSAQDLALSYLALARESPVRTAASVLRADASGALLRVEVRDGAGTLASLATVGAIRV
jgi:acyl-coenzyme A thioesterase PaaI-like protein